MVIIISFIVLAIPIIVSFVAFKHSAIGPIIYGTGWFTGYLLISHFTSGIQI